MTGETNIEKLISNMEPILHKDEYIFTTVPNTDKIPREIVVCELKEKEGITVVLTKKDADTIGITYQYTFSWITLNIHSSLNAVGLTAAFSTALGNNNISCNVIAGYYHDHIFVNKKDGKRAYDILINMTNTNT